MGLGRLVPQRGLGLAEQRQCRWMEPPRWAGGAVPGGRLNAQGMGVEIGHAGWAGERRPQGRQEGLQHRRVGCLRSGEDLWGRS